MTEQTRLGRMQLWPVDKLVPYARNPRTHSDEQVAKIAASIQEFGFTNPILIAENSILAGHGRLRAAQLLGLAQVPVIDFSHLGEAQRRAYVIADNRLALDAGWDEELLGQELRSLQTDDFDLALLGFTDEELRGLLAEIAPDDRGAGEPTLLADRFVAPPFSVLDARQGYWQNRKRAWLSLGIQSELGRRKNLLRFSPMINAAKAGEYSTKDGPYVAAREYDKSGSSGGDAWAAEGSSVFDPMLCELAYRWFCPEGGTIIDPFAGGSVRGVVAGKLGRRYVGVDLSRPQIEANELQAAQMFGGEETAPGLVDLETFADPSVLSPVQAVAPEIWLKRDDLFEYNGGRGSKVRTALVMLEGAAGVTVAGNRASPMISRVARVAERMGIPCRAHVAGSKASSSEERDAVAHGAELIKGHAQFLNALLGQARKDAAARGWVFMPLGMEGPECVAQTRRQAANLPVEVQRLVVPVGTGMSLAGILQGLDDAGRGNLPVLGVMVGMDPEKRLDKWAPANWRERVTLVKHAQDFRLPSNRSVWWGVKLDVHYEAKAAELVRPGDLLWCVAIRATAAEAPPDEQAVPPKLAARAPVAPEWRCGDSRQLAELCADVDADFIFSCPPYGDLERYSEDPRDISNMHHADFLSAYREIIAAAVARLKPDRFACFVVGDIRGPDGAYRNFVAATVQAFMDAGASLYNDAVLIIATATLPLRAGRNFSASRKLGKAHQNVLVFLKGHAARAVAACGPVDVALPAGMTFDAPEEESASGS